MKRNSVNKLYHSEETKKKIAKHFITHGMTGTRFGYIYKSAKERCQKTNIKAYTYYGKRGIEFLWKNLQSFKDDMYKSYLQHVDEYGEKDTTIERLDVNGNYCKVNCTWATRDEQRKNKRVKTSILYDKKIYTLSELADKFGIKRNVLWNRIYRYKWDMNKSLNIKN